MLRKPLSACVRHVKGTNQSLLPVSQAQIQFITSVSLIIKAIILGNIFSHGDYEYFAVSGLAVIDVNLCVVAGLGHRKHTGAVHISREHLVFGTTFISFAANIDFSAACFTQVVGT